MKSASLGRKSFVVMMGLTPAFSMLPAAPASAEFFFRPFGYTFHHPIEEPAPDVSPRRIGAILARRGFRLVGQLGYRGDQIVAAGVDARGVKVRFLVDPYEGQILDSWPIGSPSRHVPSSGAVAPVEPYGADGVPPEAGEPTVIPGVGGEAPHPARPRAAKPPRAKTAARPSHDASPAQSAAPVARPAPPPAPAESTPAAAAAPPAEQAAPSAPAAAAAAPAGGDAAALPASPQPAEQPRAATPGATNATEPQPTPGG